MLLEGRYTTQLQAGLGMIDETRILLELWHNGMDTPTLVETALHSGRFADMSARRLRNVVVECFAPRYLVEGAKPARLLKAVGGSLSNQEREQLMFLFTCRATPILADFVRQVYWRAYASGWQTLDNDSARLFVTRANQDGRTNTPWSESTIIRMASYLTGCCADFGLLERTSKSVRRILPYRLESRVAALLAHDLHFAGLGDSRLLNDQDWTLFGLEPNDVLDELKRLTLKGVLIVQVGGGVVQIGWHYTTMDEVINAITHGSL